MPLLLRKLLPATLLVGARNVAQQRTSYGSHDGVTLTRVRREPHIDPVLGQPPLRSHLTGTSPPLRVYVDSGGREVLDQWLEPSTHARHGSNP